jgi:hypothetical protein
LHLAGLSRRVIERFIRGGAGEGGGQGAGMSCQPLSTPPPGWEERGWRESCAPRESGVLLDIAQPRVRETLPPFPWKDAEIEGGRGGCRSHPAWNSRPSSSTGTRVRSRIGLAPGEFVLLTAKIREALQG